LYPGYSWFKIILFIDPSCILDTPGSRLYCLYILVVSWILLVQGENMRRLATTIILELCGSGKENDKLEEGLKFLILGDIVGFVCEDL